MTEEQPQQSSEQKKTWIKPSVTPHRSGLMNKFGAVRHRSWQEDIEGIAVLDLLKEHGSPAFVVSERQLRENFRRLSHLFRSRYPNVDFGWSYKTNYTAAVCNTFHQEGALAEVVSVFEYEKARSLGVPGEKILFNGPHKPRRILERAIAEHAHIHIDHFDELYLLEELAQAAECIVPVTIRLNFDTGYTEPWSRFGFNIETGQAMDAALIIAISPHLKLTGLHSHIGTFVLDPRAYAAQTRIMCQFMEAAEAKSDCVIESLDIGGGFASKNALQGIYLPPEEVVPSLDQYAEAICDTLLECTNARTLRGRARPRLFLETGRGLVDDTEVLITTVVANKRLPDNRRATILDAGLNLLFTAFWYNHDVRATRQLDGTPEETVLYGPLCMNIDVVRASIMLPPLKVGDSLILSPVGAYNNTQWLQFIEYRPNVLMVHEDKKVSVIRSAENLEVVTAQEHLPEHLRLPVSGEEG